MRSYIQSTRSPKAKPAHSQSPLQKKKLMKFVNQTIKHEKSMQGLSILTNNHVQNSSPIEGFKQEIERRFQASEINLQYTFPRRYSDASSFSDDSLENLKSMKEYDLHTQNFREKTIDHRIESFLESTKKKNNQNYQNSARLITSPTRGIDDSKISSGYNKLTTLTTPKDQETILYQKVLNLLENNSNKESSTLKFAKAPKESSKNSLLRQEFKRKIKLQRNEMQSALERKNKPHFRAKSLLKETAADSQRTFNLNLDINGHDDFSNLHSGNNRSDLKTTTFEDEDRSLVFKNFGKMATTKSCKDLKIGVPKTARQLDGVSIEFDSKILQTNKAKPKPTYRESQKYQKSLMDDYHKSLLTNRTSDSIVQKPEKRLRSSKGQENRHEETSRNETSLLFTNFTEGPIACRELSMNKEISKANILQRIQENSFVKSKLTQDFKSPTHVSLRTLTTLPLTARNDIDNKAPAKNPLMSFRSPKERKIIIPPASNQYKLSTEKTYSDKLDSDRQERPHSARKLTKTNSAVNISQNSKNVNQFYKVPKLVLNKKIEGDKKENRNSGPSSSRESKQNPSKRDAQLILKRNGPLSERYHLDESEGRIKSYHK